MLGPPDGDVQPAVEPGTNFGRAVLASSRGAATNEVLSMDQFEVESVLAATPEQVWRRVANMRAVNAELAPWLRMTYPRRFDTMDLHALPVAPAVAFRSLILLFRVLPVDRYSVRFERVERDRGFVEQSSTLSQRYWQHERSLEAVPQGCRVRDRVRFESRIPFLGALLRPLLRGVFVHRHQNLRRLFGEGGSPERSR
jgi:ligand-binding SRPBCC domain-containing protein